MPPPPHVLRCHVVISLLLGSGVGARRPLFSVQTRLQQTEGELQGMYSQTDIHLQCGYSISLLWSYLACLAYNLM